MFHRHAHAGMAMNSGTRDQAIFLMGRQPDVEILEEKKGGIRIERYEKAISQRYTTDVQPCDLTLSHD